jgi:hypothetical protein
MVYNTVTYVSSYTAGYSNGASIKCNGQWEYNGLKKTLEHCQYDVIVATDGSHALVSSITSRDATIIDLIQRLPKDCRVDNDVVFPPAGLSFLFVKKLKRMRGE